jgi:hypothetical protein
MAFSHVLLSHQNRSDRASGCLAIASIGFLELGVDDVLA